MFTDRLKNNGDFLGCRHFLPLPTSNSSEFRIGNSGKFTDKGPFMSAEQCQGSRRNDRLKNQKNFLGALVIFTVTDFKFWRICLVNISVGMVIWAPS